MVIFPLISPYKPLTFIWISLFLGREGADFCSLKKIKFCYDKHNRENT